MHVLGHQTQLRQGSSNVKIWMTATEDSPTVVDKEVAKSEPEHETKTAEKVKTYASIVRGFGSALPYVAGLFATSLAVFFLKKNIFNTMEFVTNIQKTLAILSATVATLVLVWAPRCLS